MTPQDSKRFVNAEYADRLEAEVAQLRQGARASLDSMSERLQEQFERLATAIGEVAALEAARDHLRARLLQLVKYAHHTWACELSDKNRVHYIAKDGYSEARIRRSDDPPATCNCGLADLLAILTEPEEKK